MSPFESLELDFGLGQTLTEIRAAVRRVAQERVAPLAQRIDQTNEFAVGRDTPSVVGQPLRR